MLARHRDKAGAIALAAASYVQAGDVARSRYANAKAAELFAKGLTLLGQCDHVDEDLRLDGAAPPRRRAPVARTQRRGANGVRRDADAGMAPGLAQQGRRRALAHRAPVPRDRAPRGASRQLTAALALFGQAQDERGIASTLDDIGKLHWLKGDYPLALEYTLRSLAMRRKLADRRSIALSLNNLGLVQQDSGNYKAALDAFEQALHIRRDIGDLVGVSITLNNLGTVSQDIRDDARALALFEEAYEVAKETGDRNRIALILTNLGETHNRLGSSAKAIALLKQAEDIADELGDRLGLAEAVRGLGKAYLARREYTKARECTQRAVELFSETESKVQLGVALRSLGEVTAAARGGGAGLRDATAHLKRSIGIFEEVGNEVELARSCRAYAELLRQSPDHTSNPAIAAEARALAKRAEDIFARMRINAGPAGGEGMVAR